MARATCPISKVSFIEDATSMDAAFDLSGEKVQLNPLEFGTGSFGWKGNGTIDVLVAGIPVTCTVHINIVAKNSR